MWPLGHSGDKVPCYPATMLAMSLIDVGGTEQFYEQTFDIPGPRRLSSSGALDELLVRVVATSVNPIDIKQRKSNWWGGKPGTENMVLGSDVAGIVVECGPRATRFKPGDAVFYTTEFEVEKKAEIMKTGSYAEYHFVKESIVAHKPEELTFAEAAAVPLAACTAYGALFERGWLRCGQNVLVHGPSTPIGLFAVQLAKAAGAHVIAVCPRELMSKVSKLGAHVVIDEHSTSSFEEVVMTNTDGLGADLVIDCIGGDTCIRSIGSCRVGARMVTCMGIEGSLNDGAKKKKLGFHFEFYDRNPNIFKAVRTALIRHQIKPIVSKEEYNFRDIATAHATQSKDQWGTTVIIVDNHFVHRKKA